MTHPALRSISVLLLVVATFLGGHRAWAVGGCGTEVKARPYFKADWRATDQGLIMGLRANAYHYWKWVGHRARQLFSKELLAEGWIVGDPHGLNFADVWIHGKKRFVLVDVDDVGRGPFLLDFGRLLLISRAGDKGFPQKEMYDAYRAGLKGVTYDKPKILKEALSAKDKEFKRAAKESVGKVSEKDRFDFEGTDLIPISEAPVELVQQLALDAPYFQARLKDYTVLDQALRVKTEGGSQGIPRYWYLVSKGKLELAYEFKQISDVALKGWSEQLDHAVRIWEALKVFWGVDAATDFFSVVRAAEGRTYWQRPRFRSNLEINMEPSNKKEREEFRQVSIYIANHLGRRHGLQPQAERLRDQIEKDPDGVFNLLMQLLNRYVEVADVLNPS
ncbi:MAG: DUF2252 family protein [Bdellovibrionaceae bacterium]|nr:DUF2252 family protein [Bdellovibrionales bacterium]MCB9083636.1 DUF2252 family protein [Pseudobdellovibrionaceae bacterium]